MAKPIYKYGDPSDVPEHVKYCVGVALGAAVSHPSVMALLADFGSHLKRRERTARERTKRARILTPRPDPTPETRDNG